MRPTTRGIALSAILLAVVLLVVIGVAIALGARSTSANSDQERITLDATAIMNQGANLANGYLNYVSQTSPWGGLLDGTPLVNIWWNAQLQSTWGHPGDFYIFDPKRGVPTQLPPPTAFADAGHTWIGDWNYPGTWMELQGVGTQGAHGLGSNQTAEFMVMLGGLRQAVCQRINQMLYNTTAIPTSYSPTWENYQILENPQSGYLVFGAYEPPSTAFDGKDELCMQLLDSGNAPHYVYLKTFLAQ